MEKKIIYILIEAQGHLELAFYICKYCGIRRGIFSSFLKLFREAEE